MQSVVIEIIDSFITCNGNMPNIHVVFRLIVFALERLEKVESVIKWEKAFEYL